MIWFCIKSDEDNERASKKDPDSRRERTERASSNGIRPSPMSPPQTCSGKGVVEVASPKFRKNSIYNITYTAGNMVIDV
jgi:hypothetical protein